MFVIVLGTNVDTDSVAATWLFCQANQIDWTKKENVQFDFVEPGERAEKSTLQKMYGKDITPVHIDTGKINNPGMCFFDHHVEGSKRESSATMLVFKKYPSDDKILLAIRDFAHLVDNAKPQQAAESCQGDFGHILETLPNILSGLQGAMALIVGLGIVQSFYNNCKKEAGLYESLAQEGLELRSNGFILYGTTSQTSKNLRNFIMRKKKSVKLIVAKYNTESKFGVSYVRQGKYATFIDLKVVLNAIKKDFPKSDCFLHQSGKFLYIKGEITLEQIWGIVEPLVGTDIALHDNLQIHEAKVRYHMAKTLEYSLTLNASDKVGLYSKLLEQLPTPEEEESEEKSLLVVHDLVKKGQLIVLKEVALGTSDDSWSKIVENYQI
jgi:hypothetical protein